MAWQSAHRLFFGPTAGPTFITAGTGTPEAVLTAPVGSIFARTDGGAATTIYVKETGTGNTGWVAYSSAAAAIAAAIGVTVQAYSAALTAIAAGTDIAVADGGTGASTASAARTNLGLAIGTDVQAYDAQLSSVIRINSQSAAYTLVLTDGGKCIFHPASDTTARTWTIPANASVAFPIGTPIQFDNQFGAGALTIPITTDTMELVGAAGSTGTRTLATGGRATAEKMTATLWRISGTAELT